MKYQIYKHKLSAILAIIIIVIVLSLQPYKATQAAPTTFTVTKTADSGTGTLRWAISQANTNPGRDTIIFNIEMTDPGYDAGKGIWTIFLTSSLSLTDSDGVEIDAISQTTNKGNTNPMGPEIAISGASLASGPIFDLQHNNNLIKGFALHSNMNGAAIDIGSSSRENIIINNFIGIRADASLGLTNKYGIRIHSGSHTNSIGGNLISNNQNNGIEISGPGGNNNIVSNYFGLDWTGSVKIANGGNGIALFSSSENDIRANVIHGNNKSGVLINGGYGNTVKLNRIGLDNGLIGIANLEHGIKLENGTYENTVIENLVIGNGKSGIFLTGTHTWGNHLTGNIIGADQSYDLIPNGNHGIGIYDGAHDNTIGSRLVANDGNIIVGNSWSGIAVVNNAHHNTISLNHIGVFGDRNDLGNNYNGVHIVNSQNNIIASNTIAYNGAQTPSAGVRVDGASANNNQILMNSIYANNDKGIDLLNGANGSITPPFIEANSGDFVEGVGCPGCVVEIFSDEGSQGRIYEGNMGAHSTTGYFKLFGPFAGPNITATQTDSHGNTSIFSSPVKKTRNCIYLPLITR